MKKTLFKDLPQLTLFRLDPKYFSHDSIFIKIHHEENANAAWFSADPRTFRKLYGDLRCTLLPDIEVIPVKEVSITL